MIDRMKSWRLHSYDAIPNSAKAGSSAPETTMFWVPDRQLGIAGRFPHPVRITITHTKANAGKR